MARISIITSTYNQLDLLKKMEKALDAQTEKDFQWIIADDGSSDGTTDWYENSIYWKAEHIWQEDNGYRLTEILNKAAQKASGEYLCWIMADSTPKADFVEQMLKVLRPNRMVNGMRVNVDAEGRIVSPDWRLNHVNIAVDQESFKLERSETYKDEPWRVMTLNTMAMPKEAYERMGGIYEGYKYYGKMDWDMAAWCYYNGIELWWAPQAMVYHLQHPDRPDHPDNEKVFDARLEEIRRNHEKE